ncbi:peptide ABC transporter permease [Methylobacterium sp. J-088]|uniref:peptide ABC transporter permease n=1 Tax=unclassified Methylobacterium TaxID=2615210 RepID=UPI001FB96195|nr:MULTISPECIES: peptide ABC transporter permease [unclassified Methylobacterium]MCJ2063979.1 peptide ABC transporter permease [Methylobacterium sp. J-088]
MPRASNSTHADPALDAAALLRRLGFFGLFVVLPVLAQVARRASVILAPIAVILLIIASVIDRRQRPVRPAALRLLTAPAFLAAMLVVFWSALSLTWTPFLGPALERLVNLAATVGLAFLGYLALPDRMRSANLYLLPLGLVAGAIVAIVLGLFGAHMGPPGAEDDGALDRGLVLLILLVWPALAWLRSRRRDREALALALLVALALTVQPDATQIAALAVGAVAFAVTSYRQKLGVQLTAIVSAVLLAVAPLLPFLARPIGSAVLGPLAPTVLSLKSWQKVVTTDPVRLITGHGFETALRGRLVGLLPLNAPTTALFEFWYELGIVGALAAAFALYASIRRAGRDGPALVPGAMGCFAAAFTVACLSVGLTSIWWLTTLAIATVVFVAVERGQFRTSRPKVAKLHRVIASGG